MAFFDKLFKKQPSDAEQSGWETQGYTSLDGSTQALGDGASPGLDALGNEIPLPEAHYDLPGEYAQRFDGVAPGSSEGSGGWYVAKPNVTIHAGDTPAETGGVDEHPDFLWAPTYNPVESGVQEGPSPSGDDPSNWMPAGLPQIDGSPQSAPGGASSADHQAAEDDAGPDAAGQEPGGLFKGEVTGIEPVFDEPPGDDASTWMPVGQAQMDGSMGEEAVIGSDGQYVITGVEHTATESSGAGPSPGAWEHQYELASGKAAQTDFDFETPSGEDGAPTTAGGFFDGRLLSVQDLTTVSPAAEGGDGADDANPADASPQGPSLEAAQPPSDGETPAVYGYDGAKGDYAVIPAATEEPVIPPGRLEYPNLTVHVPEADQVTPEPPAGPQGFGFVTFGDAAEDPADGPHIGTAIGEAIGNPAGDGSEEEADVDDGGQATLMDLAGEAPQMTLIHKAGDFDAVLSTDDSDGQVDHDPDDDP